MDLGINEDYTNSYVINQYYFISLYDPQFILKILNLCGITIS